VGAYRDDSGKVIICCWFEANIDQPYVLSCVRRAEQRLLEKQLDKEYAPIIGIPAFGKGAVRLAYGADSAVLKDERIAVTQTISGTGALRTGGEFLARFYENKTIYVPTPTWYLIVI